MFFGKIRIVSFFVKFGNLVSRIFSSFIFRCLVFGAF